MLDEENLKLLTESVESYIKSLGGLLLDLNTQLIEQEGLEYLISAKCMISYEIIILHVFVSLGSIEFRSHLKE